MKKFNKENENAIGLDEVNEILSNTLVDLSKRKISLKRAQAISRTAFALSKNIHHVELQKRIALLEGMLKQRR